MRRFLPIFGYLMGSVLMFWLLGIAFFTEYNNYFLAAKIPYGVAFVCAAILGLLLTPYWLFCAVYVALPTMLFSLLVFLGVIFEGKGLEIFWIDMGISILSVCLLGSFTGHWFSNLGKRKTSK